MQEEKGAAHKIMLMAAVAYNLQKLLHCLTHPKAKVHILSLKQDNVLYFATSALCHSHGRFLSIFGPTRS